MGARQWCFVAGLGVASRALFSGIFLGFARAVVYVSMFSMVAWWHWILV
jgi:hypothetical protein